MGNLIASQTAEIMSSFSGTFAIGSIGLVTILTIIFLFIAYFQITSYRRY